MYYIIIIIIIIPEILQILDLLVFYLCSPLLVSLSVKEVGQE